VLADFPLFSAESPWMEKWRKDFGLKMLTLGILAFRVALLTS
jgi:hypothetical protein